MLKEEVGPLLDELTWKKNGFLGMKRVGLDQRRRPDPIVANSSRSTGTAREIQGCRKGPWAMATPRVLE